jgi:hypothetical protein
MEEAQREKDLLRFMSYVSKAEDGCWRWSGGKDIKGYSIFFYKGKAMFGHRATLLLHNRVKQLNPELQICHACRNKDCVNPDHLKEGTRFDNAADKRRDKTNLAGERCHFSKLTWTAVADIRKSGESRKTLAETHGVSKSTISGILKGKTWINPPAAENITPIADIA